MMISTRPKVQTIAAAVEQSEVHQPNAMPHTKDDSRPCTAANRQPSADARRWPRTASRRPTARSGSRTRAARRQSRPTRHDEAERRVEEKIPEPHRDALAPRPRLGVHRDLEESLPEDVVEDADAQVDGAVSQTSGHCTDRMLPTSMSLRCSLSDVALLIARMTAADATA